MDNTIKTYDYTNDINEPKRLVVHPLKDGVYPCTLWSRRTGDLCGSGDLTPDELHNWLVYYGIKENENV